MGFRVWGLGFRVSGFRFQGWRFGVRSIGISMVTILISLLRYLSPYV